MKVTGATYKVWQPTRRVSIVRRWQQLAGAFRKRIASSSVRSFRILAAHQFITQVAPDLVLARFLGKPTRVELAPTDTEALLQAIGRLGRAILRLADRIIVPSFRISHKLGAYDIDATVEAPKIDLRQVVSRSITEVQPRILVYSSLAWRQDLTVIVSAFEQIQQKYPRAELTLAGPDPTACTLLVKPTMKGCLHLCQPCNPEQYLHLCRTHDIFVANAGCDLTPDHLVIAMASGLPAIVPPTGDIRPATELALLRSGSQRRFVRHRIVETVLNLIERDGFASAMSTYSRQTRPIAASGSKSARAPWRLTG